MVLLVVVHVLSAIIGIGPVFFYPVLFQKGLSREELAHYVALSTKLDYFPKIGGTIAALSGIILAVIGNYGTFLQLWLIGSLVIYIIIQVIVIGTIAPRVKKLHLALSGGSQAQISDASFNYEGMRKDIQSRFIICCLLGAVLFLFMIVKPSGF